jgi:hypothetical protein
LEFGRLAYLKNIIWLKNPRWRRPIYLFTCPKNKISMLSIYENLENLTSLSVERSCFHKNEKNFSGCQVLGQTIYKPQTAKQKLSLLLLLCGL